MGINYQQKRVVPAIADVAAPTEGRGGAGLDLLQENHFPDVQFLHRRRGNKTNCSSHRLICLIPPKCLLLNEMEPGIDT